MVSVLSFQVWCGHGPPSRGVLDIRSRRDFSSFALPPGEPPALAALPRRRSHDLFAQRPVLPSLAALGPPRSGDLFAEARWAPALAALLSLKRSEDLFVELEGPPGALERAGPAVADSSGLLVRICAVPHS